MNRRTAFTLVELLVVIGIIALLLSILLPALNRAREAANLITCLSNMRQLGHAAMLFAHDHRGHFPTSSTDQYAKLADPSRERFAYRAEPGHPDGVVVKDWASALVPYLGGRDDETFLTTPNDRSRVFRCPSGIEEHEGGIIEAPASPWSPRGAMSLIRYDEINGEATRIWYAVNCTPGTPLGSQPFRLLPVVHPNRREDYGMTKLNRCRNASKLVPRYTLARSSNNCGNVLA
jgi:prepilin-type N-terminal cleavage/methylation domain-containing protein